MMAGRSGDRRPPEKALREAIILGSRENPKIGRCDDSEVIGDGAGELIPPPGDLVAQKSEYGLRKADPEGPALISHAAVQLGHSFMTNSFPCLRGTHHVTEIPAAVERLGVRPGCGRAGTAKPTLTLVAKWMAGTYARPRR